MRRGVQYRDSTTTVTLTVNPDHPNATICRGKTPLLTVPAGKTPWYVGPYAKPWRQNEEATLNNTSIKMSDLIHRAQKAKSLIGDTSLPSRQKFSEGLEAFSGLSLTDLDISVREELEADLAAVNHLMSQIGLNEEADYQRIDESDFDQLLDALEVALTRAIEGEIDRIANALDECGEQLPVEAIEETREHRDLMVPRLIASIKVVTSLARAGDKPEGHLHFLALFLLSELQAEESLPAILEAFSLPDELSGDLFGDAVTETLARILAQFAGDRPDLMDTLIQNRELNEYVRWEAAQCYIHLVRDGRLSRGEAVARLQSCLRQAIDQKDVPIIAGLISVMSSFAPTEAMDDIREAYEKDLVETFMIDIADVEDSIAEGEATIQNSLERCPPTGIDDAIEELRSWAMFSEKPAPAPDPKPRPPPRLPQSSKLPDPVPPMREKPVTVVRSSRKVGRNDPCPCGSGKKFKKCCRSRK